MKIPEPYFANIPEIGSLVMDYIILDYDYPLLFVCKEENGNRLYLCDCCDTYKEQKWLIAPVTEQTLYEMLENRITIRKAFEEARGLCCIAVWSQEMPREHYELISAKEFDQDDLPEIGEFLDVEEEEYSCLMDYVYNKMILRYSNEVGQIEVKNTSTVRAKMIAVEKAYYELLSQFKSGEGQNLRENMCLEDERFSEDGYNEACNLAGLPNAA